MRSTAIGPARSEGTGSEGVGGEGVELVAVYSSVLAAPVGDVRLEGDSLKAVGVSERDVGSVQAHFTSVDIDRMSVPCGAIWQVEWITDD
jgi:hypothetical protein